MTMKTLSIASISALIAMTVIAFGGGAVITQPVAVPNNSITFAKLADIASARVIGRATAGTGDPEALTGTQVTALLDTFTSGLQGVVPASGGGTANFLRADGTWAAPAGSDTASDITSVAVSSAGWSAGANLTTEGTIDWAAYNQSCATLRSDPNRGSLQARPVTADPRASRLFKAVEFSCNGASTCNTSVIESSAAYTGNGISTSTGANNYSGSALSNASSGCAATQNSGGNGTQLIVRLPLFPNESATLKLYLVLVDITDSYTVDIVDDGVSSDSASGTMTSVNGSTVLHTMTIAYTAGNKSGSFLVVKVQRTSSPTNVNPRNYIVGATLF